MAYSMCLLSQAGAYMAVGTELPTTEQIKIVSTGWF